MTSFGWKTPFPLRLGGQADQLVGDLYANAKANRSSVLQGGEGSEADAEDKVIARLLASGYRAVARRVAQADPGALSLELRPVTHPETNEVEWTSMLARWETILHLVPAPGATDRARRELVSARLLAAGGNMRTVLVDALTVLLGSWLVVVQHPSLAEVQSNATVATWPGPAGGFSKDYPGHASTDRPWSSGIARLLVYYQPPAGTSQAAMNARIGPASRLLDDALPAWGSYKFIQSPDFTGFRVGIGQLGITRIR